ncbi:hypothetical protein C8F04DRAFT_712589 [Mycena alexandri]|uniref:Secreted protein n=1 Tax=Mycena alexandri TaxID=1745969 RepID=A0AAD6SPB5_9AGAR|nr:hypothetical protein C8F04DRAFT_712589 [Mycena alexandri]
MTTLLFCHSGLLLVSSGQPSSVDCLHNTAAFHSFFDTSSIVVIQDLVISGHPAPSTLTLLLLLYCFLCLPPVSSLDFHRSSPTCRHSTPTATALTLRHGPTVTYSST